MFTINDDLSIYVTRGDVFYTELACSDGDDIYTFKSGDVVRFSVCEKKNCENVLMQKDFHITIDTEFVEIVLDERDTKIGDSISKPTDYWYEVVLNPENFPRTIIGYDDNGAKVFRLYPEHGEISE